MSREASNLLFRMKHVARTLRSMKAEANDILAAYDTTGVRTEVADMGNGNAHVVGDRIETDTTKNEFLAFITVLEQFKAWGEDGTRSASIDNILQGQ